MGEGSVPEGATCPKKMLISSPELLIVCFRMRKPFKECEVLYEHGAFTQSSARMMMSALTIENIIAVTILSLLPSLAAGRPVIWSQMGAWIMRGVLLIALIFILGLYVAPRVIDRISQLDLHLDEARFLLSTRLRTPSA